MVDIQKIETIGRKSGKEFNPNKVILFGSYASGKASEDSDLDILVVMPFEGDSSARQASEIRMRLDKEIPIDIVVKRPSDLSRRISMGDMFFTEILNKGKVLYEAASA